MSVIVTARDETTAGVPFHEVPLEFPSELITVRDLIRERVYQEVQDFNRGREGQAFRGLVQPSNTERVLNGKQIEYRFKEHRAIDWKEQFEQAVKAFERNQFLILIGNRQYEHLDDEVLLSPGMQVSFVKLTLLVGG